MILISQDRTKKDALKWATSFGQPWPVMLPGEIDAKTLVAPYKIRVVPTYILVDRNGKEIVRGLSAALAAAKKDDA